MIILEDKGQQLGKHTIKNDYWKSLGIEVIRVPLPTGDYVINNDKTQDVINRKMKRNIEAKKMDFLGTYKVTVDTKKDISEISDNVCGKGHARFRDECILAQNNNIKLYTLVENREGIADLQDLFSYTSERRKRWFQIRNAHQKGKMLSYKISKIPPVSGEQLAKSMLTMQEKYGVTFLFCTPEEAGRKVIELLEGLSRYEQR